MTTALGGAAAAAEGKPAEGAAAAAAAAGGADGKPAEGAAAAAAAGGAQQTPEQIAAAAAAAANEKPLTKAEAEKAIADAVAAEKAKYAAPEKYEQFKLPEGVKPDDAVLGEFGKVAKELGLKQDGAQKLVDFYGNAVKQVVAAHAEEGNKLVATWLAEAKSDKQIGGADFDKNVGKAVAVVNKFNPTVKAIMDASGFGNHPEVIRLLVKVADAIGEDGLKVGQSGGGSTPVHPGHIMFPSMAPKS